MGPPISTWPYSHPSAHQYVPGNSEKVSSVNNTNRMCHIVRFVNTFRVICLNFTFALFVIQVLFHLNTVTAGPVIFNMDYMQGPVPIARNIRHLPCISRRTGQEGLCMFAIDCLKANGSHLGTCIDRFYFGSCCQIPDKTLLPQIIGNNIEDNTIDSGNFVHPQTEDKVQSTVSKIPNIFPTRKPTTEKILTTLKAETMQDRTEPDLELKTDEETTLNDGKVTTVVTVETTTRKQTTKTTTPEIVTDLPVKLSTFQTVSGDLTNSITEEPSKVDSSEAPKTTTISTTTSVTNKPTRRPIKPTYKPFRPSNFSRPTIQTTTKPRPTKPILVFNTTRKPPYRPPPKRPSTKKPLPSPPRLNITILPQSTSTRPVFTRPSFTTITYINTTVSSTEEPTSTTTTKTSTTSTTTTEPTTTRTTTPTTTITTTSTTETTPLATERLTEPTESVTEIVTSSIEPSSSTTVTTTTTTTAVAPSSTTTTTTTEAPSSTSSSSTTTTESVKITTLVEELVSEKETLKPVRTTEIPSSTVSSSVSSSSTDYPPLVTWSTIDGVTKAPENATTALDENWSPITPPEGWILISTIPPKQDTSSTTSTTTTTTTTTTTEAPTTISEATTISELETTVPITETTAKPSTEVISSDATTTTTTTTTTIQATENTTVKVTEAPLLEFTVNVTLSPTMPTTTTAGPTTENVTEVETTTTNVTDVATTASNATTILPDTTNTTVDNMQFLPDSVNMSDYKSVCGRRLWPLARIVGGTKSGFGQWPWQISLRQYRTSTYLHKCGAALLNENWAITAAHCVEHVPPSELLVRLGEYDLASESEPYGFAERRVQIVASHPHFDPATFEYDLALLRFYEPVKFQPNILPICVPDNDDDFVGKTAYVTGWGRLYDEGPLPSVLQEVQVPVINNTACEAMYQAAGYNEHIPNIFICAGRRRGGADSCEGDSGGPMVVQRERDNRFVLGGVISWGIGCAEPNQPGVYTRISEFRDWINQILLF
ncbi:serine proteinase stubble [Galleria mellonella]|uniref:Serine proteinase stubble n=1 Tax=Galleria mellonella TaxID=7137 RepID=A0ABM3MT03_GALME|nr:serine proteinase stubble [Galleria mellonella]XP_052754320.1 serine proteinase stubble [Galleria mellonella]